MAGSVGVSVGVAVGVSVGVLVGVGVSVGVDVGVLVGVGVLVVVHDLTLAATYCDRLFLLADGAVVAEGTPNEVVTASNVTRVYGARVTVINDERHRAPIVVPANLEADR